MEFGALVAHHSGRGEYKWSEGAVLNFHNPFIVLPFLLVFVSLQNGLDFGALLTGIISIGDANIEESVLASLKNPRSRISRRT